MECTNVLKVGKEVALMRFVIPSMNWVESR